MTRWSDADRNPNAPAVIAARSDALARARRPTIAKRLTHLEGLAQGKRVLDVGVVEHFAENAERPTWLHGRLAAAASYCLGVDILEGEVKALQDQGYNVICCDLEVDRPDGEFDLVVLGEVVEHLGNPENLLRNLGPTLAARGRLVITTPNPYALHRTWRALRGRHRDSVDHLALYGPSNMAELGERVGLRLDEYRGVVLRTLPTTRGRLQGAACRLLDSTLFTAEASCETIIYEFIHAGS